MSDSDAWDRLWTPHRMAYIRGENKPDHQRSGDDCPFCRAPALEGDESLIVARGDLAYVVLNLYPYNAGHLMVCPFRHVADYTDLDLDEVAELGALTQHAMSTLRTVSVAGAGIAGHLHQHVVPRWGGDSNFMPVIGLTKTMPQMLETTRDLLIAAW